MEMALVGPVEALLDDPDKRHPEPFLMKVDGSDYAVLVRPRGKSRLRVCGFPPLSLQFAILPPAESPFQGIEKLKLVTHCSGKLEGDKNVLEEYVAYRLFGLLTDVSYRVRLLHVTYQDSAAADAGGSSPHYAFAIEPGAILEARLGGESLHLQQVSMSQFDLEHAALVFVFQYLIGNTDWSFVQGDLDDECCHNGDLFKVGGKDYYIPYDFDLAGLVNASYAKPAPELRLRNVRKRRYRGYCLPEQYLAQAISTIKSTRDQMAAELERIPWPTAKDGQKAWDYLDQFFDKAEKEEKLLKSFSAQCIG